MPELLPISAQAMSELPVFDFSESNEQSEQREFMVPLDLILEEEVFLHPDHLDPIVELYAAPDEHGAAPPPIKLAQVEGFENTLLVVDGFYRLAAMRKTGMPHAATTVHSMPLEAVLDERVYNVASHRKAEAGRLLEAARTAWQQTPWAARLELNQALRLTYTLSSGEQLPIDTEEVDRIKQWVNTKTELWGVASSKIQETDSLSKIASPDLLAQARFNRQGRTGYCFSFVHLLAIAKAFPGQFEAQQEIAHAAIQHQLSRFEIKKLMEAAKRAPTLSLDHIASQVANHKKLSVVTKTLEVAEQPTTIEVPPTISTPQKVGSIAVEQLRQKAGGITQYRLEDWANRRERLIRVWNRIQVNGETEQVAAKAGFGKLNSLVIENNQRASFEQDSKLYNNLEIEVLNALLAGYLLPPPSLEDFFKSNGFAETLINAQIPARQKEVHKVLMQFSLKGITFYDPDSQTMAGLKPLLISEKRR